MVEAAALHTDDDKLLAKRLGLASLRDQEACQANHLIVNTLLTNQGCTIKHSKNQFLIESNHIYYLYLYL